MNTNIFQIMPDLIYHPRSWNLLIHCSFSKKGTVTYEMHRKLTVEKMWKRIEFGDVHREDFCSHVLKDVFIEKEVASHATVFMMVGVEMMAITTFIAQSRRRFDQLKNEVRSAFKNLLK